MPVPPVYAPEVAAHAVHLAAIERRRELYVGFPTVKTIAGNKVASGFVDHYLARNGVTAQLTDSPPDEGNEEGNLFEPSPGRSSASGVFGRQARTFSPVLWASEHRRKLGVAAAAAGLVAFGRRLR